MNHRKFVTIKVVLVLTVLSWVATAVYTRDVVRDYKQLKYPNLRDITIPKVEDVTLRNGMRLFLLEDHELPLIRISARIRVGSIFEPAEKIGLAAFMGMVMRTGGTKTKTGDEIDDELEQIAASVKTSIGLDSGRASVSVLKKDIDTGLNILADVLIHPAFREDKFLVAKMQVRSAISRRNDSVGRIASREFDKLIYGLDSVYARHAEYATIDNITRDDLVAFHKRYFRPNNMMMAVWGDFKTEEMIEKIDKAFEGWARIDSDLPEDLDVDYDYRKTVNFISRADINQSNIRLGHIGGLMSDPDYFALTVMNQILGGTFTGRLLRNVRSRQGLAYYVGGAYGAHYSHPGVFSMKCQTKSESTVHAIRAMIDEIHKIRQEEVTDEELTIAKESYLNSFVFNFDTKNEILIRLMRYAYHEYPADFLQKTKEAVEQVTKADVLRVARKHLHPDKLQILVVGRPEDFDEPLSVLGEVNEINITIPPPKQ